MCTPDTNFSYHLCTLCRLGNTFSVWRSLCASPAFFAISSLCFYIYTYSMLQNVILIGLIAFKNLYNFQQRISWLSHRWRTQRNAISNVNCRIQWIIESLNAPCAPWYPSRGACLFECREILNLVKFFLTSLDSGGFAGESWLLWNALVKPFQTENGLWFDNCFCLCHCRRRDDFAYNCPLDKSWPHLTSNQVGLPAELKHINKRRKRN